MGLRRWRQWAQTLPPSARVRLIRDRGAALGVTLGVLLMWQPPLWDGLLHLIQPIPDAVITVTAVLAV